MAKKQKNGKAPKVKKQRDLTKQNVRKAKRALRSAGPTGLFNFLDQHPEIRTNRHVMPLRRVAEERVAYQIRAEQIKVELAVSGRLS